MWWFISVCTVLHIIAAYRGPKWAYYFTKPFTMVGIIVVCLVNGEMHVYSWAILIALACSLVGDIFLMLPSDRFIAGLASFLLAHIAYSVAFMSQWQGAQHVGLLLLCASVGMVAFLFLRPVLGAFTVPVAVYVMVITVMAYAAWLYWTQTQSQAALLASLGATLFVLSDFILAINRFRYAFRAATALIMTTYFVAQGLFVSSVFAL